MHTISTYKKFKGKSKSTFKVVTKGGRVGNQYQITSSAANLYIGLSGTFFLKKFRDKIAITDQLHELVGAVQGAVKYDRRTGKASDVFKKYTSKEGDLYTEIQKATGSNLVEVAQETNILSNKNVTYSSKLLANPIIYSFSPLTATAGTQTTLTITGNNFGTEQGTISFANANDGGASMVSAVDSEIVSWSNTVIEVEIPYLAGTGTIEITNSDGSSHETTVPLTITYSHNNLDNSGTILPLALQDIDGNGGYTFAYHTDFNSSDAKPYFEEAFELWNCESNINFTFGDTSTIDESVSDGINIVRFDNGSELSSGVLGSVTTRFTTYCGTTNRVKVDEMDITWNDDTNWYYGSGSPSSSQYDFKTAALHELGHAHQLSHVIDEDVVMHYSLGPGEVKYTLSENDIDGAIYTMGIFTESIGCGNTAMSEKLDCCDDIVISSSPQDEEIGENSSVEFTASASNYDSVQWYVSTDNGSNYSAISDNSYYSGTDGTTLTISNTPLSYDGYMYAAYFTNVCSETAETNAATLSVFEYTSIPDSNFEAVLEALGYDDVSGDGQIPTDNINTITSLDVDDANISDLTGIEDFKSLTYLLARNNSLTSVDISNNTALLTLNLSYNSLTGIDVSNNTALKYLYINYNALTSIDVSNNTALIQFHVIDNELTALDVTNNTLITNLQFHFNTITEIDLSNNAVLSFLSGRENSLAALDVSNNPVLAKIWCGGNPISSIDTSNNPLITVFQMGYCELTYANIQNGNNTNVTGFSVAGNENLECVIVDDADYSTTNWTSIDDTTSFTENEYCRYTSVPDENFEAALENLGYDDISGDGQVPTTLIENVTSLIIAENAIDDTTGIADFTSLTELEFYQSGVSSIDLSNNTLLETITITDNPLTSINISGLTNLQGLTLVETDITSIDISSNTSVVVLDISDNPALSSVDLRNGNNSNFTSFDATNNASLTCIKVDDADYSNTNWSGNIDIEASFTITEYCRYTSIPDANFEATIEANDYDDILGDGQVPTALIEVAIDLYADNEGITDFTGLQDFTALEDLYISESTVETLDLSGNINLKLLEAHNCELSSLDISQNTRLEELHAYSNDITSLDTSNNTSLKILSIYNNKISSLDLTSNTTLELVEVYNNQLTQLNIQNGKNNLIETFDVVDNTGLTCIRVDDVDYSNTNWSGGIDDTMSFSEGYCRYTTIPDSNFEAALEALGYDDISGDGQVPTVLIEEITTLDVNTKSITDVTGIEDFVALTSLTAYDNNIGTIDVSNNLNLITLDCQFNGLSTLDISANTALQYLSANGNSISSIDLSNNTELLRLGMYDNDFTTIDVSNNTKLTEIDLFQNQLTSIDVSNNTLLTNLYLESNNLITLDLSNNTALKNFTCNSNNLENLNIQNGANTNISTFIATNNANLTCVQVDDAAYSTSNWMNIDDQTTFNETSCDTELLVSVKVILEGAFDIGNDGIVMHDNLRDNDLLPTTSPYNASETCNVTVFDTNGTNAVVDWVEVQLRNSADISEVLYTKSALLLRNGNIVDVDGISEVGFDASAGDYHVAVAHRNHLTIGSITIQSLSTTTLSLDLTTDANVYNSSNALINMGDGYYAMPGGDIDGNGQIQNADIDTLIQLIGNSTYDKSDVDMNGQIQNTDLSNFVSPNLGKGEQLNN